MKQLIKMIIFGQFLPSIGIKKVSITLQFSYLINLHFPYDIVNLHDGCEANAINFVLPLNNNLNVEPIDESP